MADRLAVYLQAIDELESAEFRRLFRVLLGGILIDVSNVVVNGKGRRYRRNWRARLVAPESVTDLFAARVRSAITDIHRYRRRSPARSRVIHADARCALPRGRVDVAVFSPPYPNSFDYTDVYNIELWILGYLSSTEDNWRLRHETLSSHVQLQRLFRRPARRLSAAPGRTPRAWGRLASASGALGFQR